jgi:hypothetical protein
MHPRLVITLVTLAVLAVLAAAAAISAAPADAARLDRADRAEINRVVDQFVILALKRRDPAAAWSLASRNLRAGSTPKDWARGEVPALPYPARGKHFHTWSLSYAQPKRVGIDLLLQPVRRLRKTQPSIMFEIDLHREGGHWKVDTIMPTATYAPEGQQPRMYTQADTRPNPGINEGEPRLAKIWWFAVIGPFALVPIVAAALWIAASARARRAAAAHDLGSKAMPELPLGLRKN